MSLDKALADALKSVPECVAGAYVDLDSGMLLAVKTMDSHPQEVLDMVSAATTDMFQGPSVLQIENHFKKARGSKDEHHYFQEFLVFSDNLIHVFMRTKKYPNHVITYVCRKSANIGMVLAKARMTVEDLSSNV